MGRKCTALIDQSVKISDTAQDTVIAYSAEEDNIRNKKAIILPSYHKKRLVRKCISIYDHKKGAYFSIFGNAIYMLIREPIAQNEFKRVIIDREYSGNNDKIKTHIKNALLNQSGFSPNKIPTITFDEIHNYQDPLEPHEYANRVRTGKDSPDIDKPLKEWEKVVLPSKYH
ncbi:MAG: hypothetical protein SVV03_00995 [Candidatus Nanohaloarchaea archaeon]|nr:hypothetical protein [Candidatus Nanohaloarchaea archaeon]